MPNRIDCFKAYDVRGRVPGDVDARLARALGRATVEMLGAKNVVIGRDCRLSGPLLRDALGLGLSEAGAQVTDIGMCGTEEIYYAAASRPFDAGVMITASHNPADENGFKLVRGGAIPLGSAALGALRDRVSALLGENPRRTEPAHLLTASYRADYVRWLLQYSGAEGLAALPGRKPLKIVADAGNGCAGLMLGELARRLPFDFICLNMEPDGNFPNGVPNPLLPERRAATAAAVRAAGADMGVAWDGDFDRCFLYDGEGNFIDGYYCIGLLVKELLRRVPGRTIVHDTRVYWNTREIVVAEGGRPVMSKTGHSFMKERMREEDAVYGGELSGHHYFRDFAYCDSGMLPWLLAAIILHRSGRPLADLVAERMARFPCSGEINRRVHNPRTLMQLVRERYAPAATHEDSLDGVNMEFPDWRFNLRMSNTEPLLRLNAESRGDRALLEDKTAELLGLLDKEGGTASS